MEKELIETKDVIETKEFKEFIEIGNVDAKTFLENIKKKRKEQELIETKDTTNKEVTHESIINR